MASPNTRRDTLLAGNPVLHGNYSEIQSVSEALKGRNETSTNEVRRLGDKKQTLTGLRIQHRAPEALERVIDDVDETGRVRLEDDGRPVEFSTKGFHTMKSQLNAEAASIAVVTRDLEGAMLRQQQVAPYHKAWVAFAADATSCLNLQANLDPHANLDLYVGKPSKDDEAHLSSVSAEASRIIDEIKATKALDKSAEDWKADVLASLNRRSLGVTLTHPRGAKGKADFRVPIYQVKNVVSDSGYIPTVPDPTALFLHYFRDEIEADLMRQVDEHFADGRPFIDDIEREKRLKKLDAQLRMVELDEGATIIRLVREGVDVLPRPGLPVTALLGLARR